MAGDIHNITISVILYIYYYYRNSIHFQPFDYIIQQKLFWKIGQSYSISLIIYFEAYNIVLLGWKNYFLPKHNWSHVKPVHPSYIIYIL